MEDEIIRSKGQQQQQLLIKLKIPKLDDQRGGEEDEEEEEELEEGEIKEDHPHDDVAAAGEQPIDHHSYKKVTNAVVRICPECSKEFSSGKALGGHMRIHAQQQKKYNDNKLIKSSSHVQKKTNNPHHHMINKGHDQKQKHHHQSSYYTTCHDGNGRPFCNLCGKNFPSLKSLFGHMRCHPEREWRGILPPPDHHHQSVPHVNNVDQLKNSENNHHHHKASDHVIPSSSQSDDDDSRSRSDKSEDDYCEYGYNSSVGMHEVVGDLPRWAVRAKRGQKALVSTPEISAGSEQQKEEEDEEEEEEEEIRDAVEDLMRLAQGDQSFDESGLTHKQRVDDFEATNSNSLTDKAGGILDGSAGSKKRKFDHGIFRNMDQKGKGKVIGREMINQKPVKLEYGHKKNLSDEDEDEDDDDDDGSDSNEQLLINYKYKSCNANCGSTDGRVLVMKNNTSVSSTTSCKRKRIKRKKMKLMMALESDHNLDHSPTTSPAQAHDKTLVVSPDKYKCSTCNKSFPTHQALGGHRSSHNKFKITVLNAVNQDEDGGDIQHPTVNQQLAVDEIVKESETVAPYSTGTHQCKICNKVFPTGQALGGHKRCHWTGPAAEQGQSSQVTSPGEASQTQTAGSQKVHDFDLNEPPPMEDEAGYGHAYHASSSSNNSSIG